VEPTAKLAGEYGVTEIETNVAVDLVVAELEQPTIPRVKAATNPIDSKAVINFTDFLSILNFPHYNENIARCNPVG
jgi:hypothetical protein